VANAAEAHAMRRAIELAARGRGTTSPNPLVGAVILGQDGLGIAGGHHEVAGGPHAEVVALERAAEQARGATMIVTLEPCAHVGRTGACTQAIIDAGIRRVVYAVADPTAEAGGGADVLRAAGVDVEQGVLEREAAEGNEVWLHAMREQRPFVTWKYAATLDGRIAAPDGTSRWISGPQARAQVHELRSVVDAIVVGTGTALADDPELTARDADGEPRERQPLRVVVGRRELPATAKLRDTAVAETIFLDAKPAEVLRVLHERDVRSVLLEGGPTLAGAFLRAELIDEVRAYLAPMLLGGGASALMSDVATLTDGQRLAIRAIDRVGADIRVDARPSRNRPEES
jgi:diaminohydroxyphosphoribosylaminopyrimidine deaminase / 5-amino-6-(5-phosphoribosylamino)uracil reductase